MILERRHQRALLGGGKAFRRCGILMTDLAIGIAGKTRRRILRHQLCQPRLFPRRPQTRQPLRATLQQGQQNKRQRRSHQTQLQPKLIGQQRAPATQPRQHQQKRLTRADRSAGPDFLGQAKMGSGHLALPQDSALP